jgi:hypothetical protein
MKFGLYLGMEYISSAVMPMCFFPEGLYTDDASMSAVTVDEFEM